MTSTIKHTFGSSFPTSSFFRMPIRPLFGKKKSSYKAGNASTMPVQAPKSKHRVSFSLQLVAIVYFTIICLRKSALNSLQLGFSQFSTREHDYFEA